MCVSLTQKKTGEKVKLLLLPTPATPPAPIDQQAYCVPWEGGRAGAYVKNKFVFLPPLRLILISE